MSMRKVIWAAVITTIWVILVTAAFAAPAPTYNPYLSCDLPYEVVGTVPFLPLHYNITLNEDAYTVSWMEEQTKETFQYHALFYNNIIWFNPTTSSTDMINPKDLSFTSKVTIMSSDGTTLLDQYIRHGHCVHGDPTNGKF